MSQITCNTAHVLRLAFMQTTLASLMSKHAFISTAQIVQTWYFKPSIYAKLVQQTRSRIVPLCLIRPSPKTPASKTKMTTISQTLGPSPTTCIPHPNSHHVKPSCIAVYTTYTTDIHIDSFKATDCMQQVLGCDSVAEVANFETAAQQAKQLGLDQQDGEAAGKGGNKVLLSEQHQYRGQNMTCRKRKTKIAEEVSVQSGDEIW